MTAPGSNSRFGRSARLLASEDFRAVLHGGRRLATGHFQVYAMASGEGCARLGLIVAAKAERLAVRRNFVKRRVREAFRGRQAELRGLDVVVKLRGGKGEQAQGRVLREELNGAFDILAKWRASFSD